MSGPTFIATYKICAGLTVPDLLLYGFKAANAPGRLSSTNVSLNIQQAEREREAARQRESLEGWDSILGIRTELSDKQAGC
eukprot:1161696-Pelagomonas_calceolata.AAC.4